MALLRVKTNTRLFLSSRPQDRSGPIGGPRLKVELGPSPRKGGRVRGTSLDKLLKTTSSESSSLLYFGTLIDQCGMYTEEENS